MPSRKNRPDKMQKNGVTPTPSRNSTKEVEALCEQLNLRVIECNVFATHSYYDIGSISPWTQDFFCCYLSYSTKLDRWGVTHNAALTAEADMGRLIFKTAEEAVNWYKNLRVK